MSNFRCYLVRQTGNGQIKGGMDERPLRELPDGDVDVEVKYSSLNYKDALAATGHRGVVRNFPHVPGIDAAGTVVSSQAQHIDEGSDVIVTSYELGAGRWGGWSECIRVPAEWIVPLPDGLSLHEAMVFGTAGLTAALSLQAVTGAGVSPGDGEVLVTGATGGVGCLATAMLSLAGFNIVAATGKSDRHDWLKQLGANRVIDRSEVLSPDDKPMQPARWAGAIDCVGGETLAAVVRSTKPLGCVAACGLVGGVELPLSVYPFILRGVTLAGIDSANCPVDVRQSMWNQLAGDWKVRLPDGDDFVRTVPLTAVGEHVERMLNGESAGRTVIDIGG